MFNSLAQFIIFVSLLLGIFLPSAKLFSQDAFAQFVLDCAFQEYMRRAPLQLRDPCTGVVEDAFDDALVPPLTVDCDPFTTGAACCSQLADTYTAMFGTPITATCSPACVNLIAIDFVCPYFPPPDNGCGFPNYPNACSLDSEPLAAFCCNFTTPTPTSTPTPTPTPTY